MRLLFIILCFVSQSIFAQQRLTYDVSAGLRENDVKIDGSLNDWKLSDSVVLDINKSGELGKNSAKAYFMYDSDNLYVALDINDPTPMQNSIDPIDHPNDGWQQDCVRLHFWTDMQKEAKEQDLVTNISSYFYTPESKVVCFIDHIDYRKDNNDLTNIPHNALGGGIQVAFKRKSDNSGYIQEMRISRANLMHLGRSFEASSDLRCGVEVFWGDENNPKFYKYHFVGLFNKDNPRKSFFHKNKRAWGNINLAGNEKEKTKKVDVPATKGIDPTELMFTTKGDIELKYSIPYDAHVSLVIETLDGKRIRNLISDYPRTKGENIDYWDGKDDDGNFVKAGKYRFRGIYHDGINLNYRFSLEYDSFNGPWLAGFKEPLDVFSASKTVYISSKYGKNTLVALGNDGEIKWTFRNNPGGLLARGNRYLYMISDEIKEDKGIVISRINPATGDLVADSNGVSIYTVLKNYSSKYGREGVHKDNVMGFAYAYGKLWVSLYFDESLVSINPDTMKVIKEYEFKRPCGLAVNNDGQLYAIRDRSIVSISEIGTIKTIVEVGLREPISFCFDKLNNIYVTDWKKLMYIKVFSPKGKPLGRIGMPGGRPLVGPYNSLVMQYPRGVAIDSNQRLWVTENCSDYKKVSVWSTNAKLLYEFIALDTDKIYERPFIDLLYSQYAFVGQYRLLLDWEKEGWRIDKQYLPQTFKKFKPADYLGVYRNLELSPNSIKLRDKEGSVLWRYPNNPKDILSSRKVSMAKRGQIHKPNKVIGVAKTSNAELFCLSGQNGQAYVMTKDGLFVSALFKDYHGHVQFLDEQVVPGTLVSNMTCGLNWNAGQFFKNKIDGNYYITDLDHGWMVTRIVGLDTVAYINPSQITLKNQKPQKVNKAEKPRENINSIVIPKVKVIPRGGNSIDKYSWANGNVAKFELDETHSVQATMAYDDKYLYLYFKVKDPTPMINSSDNFRTFCKYGDAVVCDIRVSDSTNGAICEGDKKLVFAECNGKPVVTLYDYRVRGTTFPAIFSSVTGSQRVDVVKHLKNVDVSFSRMDDSYVMDARVKLDDIGFGPVKGQGYKADLGVLYSNKKGDDNKGYLFWSCKKSLKKSDITKILQISPASWCKLIVE